ncbi:competence protein ComEC [Weissella uvarum]|uniref:DNA internalization-related competence protein ComEC/Rec2 n=1 Tax=Weissella uvarum TaxID=1479233 RepID=UPI00196174CC|nr:DNA internalization-related competence protein ComEC/Rec2 [Weissella uvarum]MBM7618127.1 competence protein ComEC [Weissella uvarum]MCM0595131.1 DNA internalization-related competence protein ComEC/Rec2 [Weissella uvarum]
MRGSLAHFGIFVIGLNLVSYGQNWFGLCFLGYGLCLMVWFRRQNWRWWLTISLCLLAFWLFVRSQVMAPLQHLSKNAVQHTLLIHLDQCDIKNNQLNGIAYESLRHQPVRISVQHLTSQQKQLIQRHFGYVEVSGAFQVEKIQAARNFYQFNPALYWYGRGVVCRYRTQSLKQVQRQNVSIGSGMWWQALIKNSHLVAVHWFDGLPSGLKDYAETLILGYVPNHFFDEHQGLQKLGLIHLFSISGFQVQLLMVGLTFICRRLRWLKEQRLIFLEGVLIVFWCFAQEAQGLVRAVVAESCVNLCKIKQIRLNRFDIWGITVVLSLSIVPGLLCQFGGQLTFILSFAALWIRRLPSWLVVVHFNLAILPWLLWQTFEWHPVSLLANLILVPIFAYTIVPIVLIGLASYGVGWLSLTNLIDKGLLAFQKVLEQIAQLPGNCVFGKPPLLLMGLLTIITFAYLIWHNHKLLIGLIGTYALTGFIIQIQQHSQVVFIDVGQGDATYLKLANGETMLVDVGGRLSFGQNKLEQMTQARWSVQPVIRYLKANGIQSLDYLVLTHKDVDHIGNLSAFLAEYCVRKMIVPAGMETLPQLTGHRHQPEIVTVMAHQNLTNGITVLAPDHIGSGENADSIALHVDLNWASVILTGDLDQAGEQRILKQFDLPATTILKLGHHGSKTSSSAAFIAKLNPQVAIVSAGENNRYGHPHAEVIERLKTKQVQIYQTPQCGMLRFRATGNGHWTFDFALHHQD